MEGIRCRVVVLSTIFDAMQSAGSTNSGTGTTANRNGLSNNRQDSSDEDTDADDRGEKKEGETEQADELLVQKKVKTKNSFNEDLLTSEDGLARIYDEFPRSFKVRGRGHEADDLARLLNMYKEWGFQLHSGVAFPDLLMKCEVLGGKAKTRTCLGHLREQERDRYLVSRIAFTFSKRLLFLFE